MTRGDVSLAWSSGLIAGIGGGEISHHWHTIRGSWHGGWFGVVCLAVGVGIYLAIWWDGRR